MGLWKTPGSLSDSPVIKICEWSPWNLFRLEGDSLIWDGVPFQSGSRCKVAPEPPTGAGVALKFPDGKFQIFCWSGYLLHLSSEPGLHIMYQCNKTTGEMYSMDESHIKPPRHCVGKFKYFLVCHYADIIHFYYCFNPILQGHFQARSTLEAGGGGGWRGHKVPAAFFSETVKATTIKLGTQTN